MGASSIGAFLADDAPPRRTGSRGAARSAEPRRIHAPFSDVNRAQGTVLVADDDPDLRDTLADILLLEGYQVLEAADGEEALQAMGRHAVDVLILDMSMPKRDGLSVLEALGPPPPKVIVLSAFAYYGPEDIERMGLGGKVARALQKPTPPVQLLAAVRDAMAESGQED